MTKGEHDMTINEIYENGKIKYSITEIVFDNVEINLGTFETLEDANNQIKIYSYIDECAKRNR